MGLALTGAGGAVRGVSRTGVTLRRATEIGAIQGGSLELRDEVAQAGLIILAAPTRTSIRLLSAIAPLAEPGTIITDVCSSKGGIVDAMNSLPEGFLAVGGHPMAGKETAGINAADPDLFKGTTWVLVETRRTDERSRQVCETLVDVCGAKALWAGTQEHDHAVAAISHVPLLTAAALVLAAEQSGSELAWRLAASGFRDSTRLAAGEVEMGADLLLTNSTAVSEAHALLTQQLDLLAKAVRERNGNALTELLTRAAECRRGMYHTEGTGARTRKAES